jgi:ABC-type sugar transport system ATPase subunit
LFGRVGSGRNRATSILVVDTEGASIVDGQETMRLTTIKTARERGIAFVVSRQDSTGLWHDFDTLAGEAQRKANG